MADTTATRALKIDDFCTGPLYLSFAPGDKPDATRCNTGHNEIEMHFQDSGFTDRRM
jgi:hypothetical protein